MANSDLDVQDLELVAKFMVKLKNIPKDARRDTWIEMEKHLDEISPVPSSSDIQDIHNSTTHTGDQVSINLRDFVEILDIFLCP